jgi:hypothetical protein
MTNLNNIENKIFNINNINVINKFQNEIYKLDDYKGEQVEKMIYQLQSEIRNIISNIKRLENSQNYSSPKFTYLNSNCDNHKFDNYNSAKKHIIGIYKCLLKTLKKELDKISKDNSDLQELKMKFVIKIDKIIKSYISKLPEYKTQNEIYKLDDYKFDNYNSKTQKKYKNSNRTFDIMIFTCVIMCGTMAMYSIYRNTRTKRDKKYL